MDHDRGLILPSPDVTATVATAPVPPVPPAAIEHCVMAVADAQGRIADWLLDHEAAFGDVDVLQHYARWRSTWEASWPLESLSSLRTLQELAAKRFGVDDEPSADAGPGPADDFVGLDLSTLARDEDLEVEWRHAPKIAKSLDKVRQEVLRGGGTGLGVIDATPGSRREGLARTWPGIVSEELVVDGDVHITIEPFEGLVVATRRAGDAIAVRWADVGEVDLTGDRPRLVVAGEPIDAPADLARPLGWLVPGVLRWRVRAVPLVVVWAKTFAGFEQAAAQAYRRHAPLRLTTSSLATSPI